MSARFLPGPKPLAHRKVFSASVICALSVACVLLYVGINLSGADEISDYPTNFVSDSNARNTHSTSPSQEDVEFPTTDLVSNSDSKTLSESKKLEILRKVIGEVQKQVSYTLSHGDFELVPGNPKVTWEDKTKLQGPNGHDEWLHGGRVVWAPMPPLKKWEHEGAKKPLDVSDDAMDKCLSNRRVFVAGTSYHREVYFTLSRMLKQNTYLDEKAKMVPSQEMMIKYGKACKPYRNTRSWVSGGIAADGSNFCYVKVTTTCSNLVAGVYVKPNECGMPPNSSYFSEEHNAKIMYQFKTYLDTPPIDRHIGDIIGDTKSNTWDTLVLGAGEWGQAGQQYNEAGPPSEINPLLAPPKQDLSEREKHSVQASRYLSVLFPQIKKSGAVVLAYCGPHRSRSCRQWCEVSKRAHKKFMSGESNVPVLLFESIEMLVKPFEKIRDKLRLPAVLHGHNGPIVDAYTRIMMAARCRVSELTSKLVPETLLA